MVQISTPAPCTVYTVKSLFCINSKEKLTEFYGMVTVYSGLYQKPLVVQKITILNYEKTTHTMFKLIYEPILSTNSENHIKNIKKLYTWDTSTETIAATTILQLEVHTHASMHARTHTHTHTHTHTYVATDNYRPGTSTWTVYHIALIFKGEKFQGFLSSLENSTPENFVPSKMPLKNLFPVSGLSLWYC